MVKIAINGFGRIGKLFFLAAMEHKVSWDFIINENANLDYIVYSLKYDSTHPSSKETIKHDGKFLYFGKKKIKVISEMDAAKLPWKDEKVDIVVDCTGAYTKAEDAKKHISAGAKKVLISAPAKGHDVTIVYGVNDSVLKKEHTIISAGSCTTNCIAPMMKIINDAFKVKSAFFVTTHAETATQRLIDGVDKKDFRRGRAAASNISPSSSGASQSVVEAIPELKDKLQGYALRVPVIDGSFSSVVAHVEKKVTPEEINALFKKKASEIISYNQDDIVSSDIIHNPSSCIFESTITQIVGDQISIGGWYDNEWGYSNRLVDVTNLILSKR